MYKELIMLVVSPTRSKVVLSSLLILLVMLIGLRLHLDSPVNQVESNRQHHTRSLLGHPRSLEAEFNNKKSFPSARSTNKKGFVISLQYPGQQGAGIRALGSFQCLLGSMTSQLVIAEPYFEGTKLRGVPLTNDKLKLSSLFDLDYFNTASRGIRYPELVDVNSFILNRPEPVILVRTEHEQSSQVVWTSRLSGNRTNDKVKCLSNTELSSFSTAEKKMVTYMVSSMRRLESKRICVVRVINLDRSATSFNRSDLQDFIFGEWQPEDVTLSFDNWSGPHFIPVPDPAHGMNCKKIFVTNGTEVQFKPSPRLMQDAEKYRKAYLTGNRTLAVMFRLEKITNSVTKKDKSVKTSRRDKFKYSIQKIEKCIEEVKHLQGVLEETTEWVPLVTMDVGSFGSKSLKGDTSKVMSMANYTIAALYHDKWTLSEWESSYARVSGGETNKAYVAALQRTLASMADCLVLVGGGNFQALALQDYMRNHRARGTATGGSRGQGSKDGTSKLCVHVLCTTKKNEALINRILQRYSS